MEVKHPANEIHVQRVNPAYHIPVFAIYIQVLIHLFHL